MLRSYARHAAALARGKRQPGRCPICGPTVFKITMGWLREGLVCMRCGSVPRQRAFVTVLERTVPGWRDLEIFESSPGGASSVYIANRCAQYMPSQYFEGVASGEYVGDVRREDLQEMTLRDDSVDLVLTQDVFEHVLEPERGWREIARVLRPGGVHLWTVPIFVGEQTRVRVEPDGSGGLRHLMEPDYHGNPLGGGSLVVHEWGDDVMERADHASGMTTTCFELDSRLHGIKGLMKEVLFSRKP